MPIVATFSVHSVSGRLGTMDHFGTAACVSRISHVFVSVIVSTLPHTINQRLPVAPNCPFDGHRLGTIIGGPFDHTAIESVYIVQTFMPTFFNIVNNDGSCSRIPTCAVDKFANSTTRGSSQLWTIRSDGCRISKRIVLVHFHTVDNQYNIACWSWFCCRCRCWCVCCCYNCR
jgi:hypothetical protein